MSARAAMVIVRTNNQLFHSDPAGVKCIIHLKTRSRKQILHRNSTITMVIITSLFLISKTGIGTGWTAAAGSRRGA